MLWSRTFRFFLVLVAAFLAATASAYEPSATTPYTFTGCAVCGTYSNERVGDGNFHQEGCGQSGPPLYFCDCSIGYAATEMLKPPVLRVVEGTNNIEVEYWARNIYCNPPADGGNIHEPNAVSYRILIVPLDPVTLASGSVLHTIAPYWEHGKVTLTNLSPACQLYRAIYLVDTTFGVTYAVSSNVVGATGSSVGGGASCLLDMGSCPGWKGPAPSFGVSPAVGKPINVGSGNMYYSEPLFTISGPGASALQFELSYNSRETNVGALGPGFTHPFDQRLTTLGSHRLQRGSDGLRALWVLENHPPTGQIRRSVYPGDGAGTMTQGTTLAARSLDGSVTEFNTSTGRWMRASDRWGNAITGTYTGSDLTTITDALGRTLTLTYTSGQLVSVTDTDGNVWRFAFDGSNRLEKVFDPLHTGATPWRQYTWVTYAAGKPAVLAKVTDDSGAVLEAHQYDAQGRAISSWSGDTVGTPPSPGPNARDLVTLSYDTTTQTTVTSTIDSGTPVTQSTVYTLKAGAGRFLATSIVGTCVSCGATEDAVAYTFDDANHPLSRIAGAGAEQVETRYAYDANGMVTSMTEAYGTTNERTTSYAYGESDWPSFVTSLTETSVAKPGQSTVTSSSWNAAETQLTRSVSGYLTSEDPSPTVYTTVTTYDAKHRMTQVNGPVTNEQTSWSYYGDSDANLNRRGRLETVIVKTTATGTLVTSYDEYDVYGTPKLETDPNQVELRRTLDARGRTLTARSVQPSGDPNEPADYVTAWAYDSRDRLTAVTLPLANQLTYAYEEGTNRVLQTIRVDALANQRERMVYTLNTVGDKTSESYEECTTPAALCGSWTVRKSDAFTYDSNGRLTTIEHPDATTATYDYDTRGNLASVKDERHTEPNTIYAYDALNRLTSVTQTRASGGNVVTEYDYDSRNNLTTVTDPNGNITSYTFDDFGRMRTQVSPVTGTTTYGYDAAGNLQSVVDANGASTTRTYDLANRPLTATSARSGQVNEVVTWGYDDPTSGYYGLGRLTSMVDPAGVTTYKYDRRGLVRADGRLPGTCRSSPFSCTSLRSALTTSYGHDANGNRTSVQYGPSGYPPQNSVMYAYDFGDRPSSATSGTTALITSASYLPFGPVRELVFGNGTTQTFTRDNRYFPLTTVVMAGAVTLASYDYANDGAGNVTEIHDLQDATRNRDFGYDDLNRLTTATGGASLWGAGSYSYDAMGNLLSSTLGSVTTTFAYSGITPKLTSVTRSGQTPVSVTYDDAGNELQGENLQSISPRNLVRSILTPAIRAEYKYDGRGVRMETRLYPAGGGDWTSMIRHAYTPELRPLARHEYANVWGLPSLIQVTSYVWFGDRPIAQIDVTSQTTRYTAADHLGTPFLQTDATGTVAWRAESDPYGAIFEMRTGSEATQPLRLPGQEVVNGVTERYNIFRWYRAGWGRYTQPDPLGRHDRRYPVMRGSQPASQRPGTRPVAIAADGLPIESNGLGAAVNTYAYAEGSPLMLTDPLGLSSWCVVYSIFGMQADYKQDPLKPWGQTFKGCLYGGICGNFNMAAKVYKRPGCRCDNFCVFKYDEVTGKRESKFYCFPFPIEDMPGPLLNF